jgi:hypothetical protein
MAGSRRLGSTGFATDNVSTGLIAPWLFTGATSSDCFRGWLLFKGTGVLLHGLSALSFD